jgi:hypothetical protein
VATIHGFVSNFDSALVWEAKEPWSILRATVVADIMGIRTPRTLSVLSAFQAGDLTVLAAKA